MLTTPKAVIPKLLNGADLMVPGGKHAHFFDIMPHYRPKSSVITCPNGLQQNQIVSIAEYAGEFQSHPVAVGTMAIDSSRLSDDIKGKAVYTLHVEGDELWALGSKTSAPLLPQVPQQSDEITARQTPEQTNEQSICSEVSQVVQDKETNVDPCLHAKTDESIKQDTELSPEGQLSSQPKYINLTDNDHFLHHVRGLKSIKVCFDSGD
jgi:hypothetical protein